MKKEHLALWQQIATFKLDDPEAARPFSKKLAEENKWSEEKTLRVITEYKKFLFLCVTKPNGASPSPTVDAAWHLHLTYTENYWGDLCKNILKTELHHKPSKGGMYEQNKHDTWYVQTLMAYTNTFGFMPPEDIWTYPTLLNPTQYLEHNSPFLIQKKEKKLKIASNTVDAGNSDAFGKGVNDYEFGDFDNHSISATQYWLYFAYGLIALLGIAVLYPPLLKGMIFLLPLSLLGICICVLISEDGYQRNEDLNEQINDLSDELSPYIGAWILGGRERLTTTLLYEATKNIQLNPTTKRLTFTLKQEDDLYKNPIYTLLQTVEKAEIPLATINETVQPIHTHFKAEVLAKGFSKKLMDNTNTMLLIAFALISFTRFMEGITFHKPMLYLGLTVVVFAIAFIITYFSNPVSFKEWRDGLSQKYSAFKTNESELWSFALGSAAFTGALQWYSYENYLRPQHNKNGSDGGSSFGCGGSSDGGSSCGGSSCGGSSCGGGCGGCGGGD
jgi:hypothetical protein